ncbi:MAG: hypothetical protein AW09_003898 [Candidatus Accumulibacter phosphatis]|uniref:Uncharacterized protein n=1 Tax=Candidatus Accumulibacter phosphatis TaxID=327160 RepID=A0A080LRT6_9PROT|nr:MAG: hypothetical protein AW09_003898 [Candidatus Accumulibacter phosphatis]
MQSQGFSDLAQDQWPHRDFPVIEELALTFHNSLRHTQDRVKPLLHILDQPASLLELSGETRATLSGKNLGVETVDAQPWEGVGIDVYRPLSADFAHYHIRCDITGFRTSVCGSGPRIQAADQQMRGTQGVVLTTRQLLDLGKIVTGQQFQVLTYDLLRQRAGVIIWTRCELQ